MNKTAMDILSYYGVADEVDALAHVGVAHDENPPGRGSGRYGFGTGENKYQHVGREFYDKVNELKKQGMSEKDIAKEFGLVDKFGTPSTGVLRDMYTTAKNRVRIDNHNKVVEMRDSKGMTWQAIADELGLASESSARSLYNGNSVENDRRGQMTADELKRILVEKGPLDIGAGTAEELSIALKTNITETRLKEAIYILKEEGYVVENIQVPQPTNPGQKTTMRILAAPGTDPKELRDYSKINSITNYISHDEGDSLDPVYKYPASLDPKRLDIRYAEQGGTDMDGVIELRRGVADLNLGKSNYAQVRILVGGTHYLKGMAVYSDDLPKGIDIRFNTNKHEGKPMMAFKDDGSPSDAGVLKPIKNDPQDPFGSLIKPMDEGGQYYYEKNGKKELGLINKTREEGEWDTWKDKLPSQFLSKQPQKLIDNQLNLSIAKKKAELEEINSLTNPTLKKKFLADFAGKCDSAAVDLKAASFPGQKYHVILPLKNIKDGEVYAPNYAPGTMVALVRFPHAGPFEIPICRVNNDIPEGDMRIGKNAIDAIGINSKTASQLSGADFDGDTVILIPMNDRVRIHADRPIKELVDFDPKSEYAYRPGMKEMTKGNTQMEMGKISNLITDMYAGGASKDEIIRATKHSMVVIDAEKHHLDYTRSEKENDIQALKKTYQKHIEDEGYGGANTIISKAKSPYMVEKRQGSARINPDGTVWYKKADDLKYIDNKTGEQKVKMQKSTKMAETKNAFDLVSDIDNPMERAYANYANSMKALAIEARKTLINTKDIQYNPQAYKAYKADIDILKDQINEAQRNRPKERLATAMATAKIQQRMKLWKEDNPAATKSEYKAQKKKISDKEMKMARKQVGAARKKILLTDRQWDAINQGAMHKSTLDILFRYADMDDIYRRATPRRTNDISPAKRAQIKAMKASGYTNQEIAEQTGYSVSTIVNYMKENR